MINIGQIEKTMDLFHKYTVGRNREELNKLTANCTEWGDLEKIM